MSVPVQHTAGGAVSLIDSVGWTPLLSLARLGRDRPGVSIVAKAEWYNPGGSVKDRAALRMIRDAERSGTLRRGKTILDASSGNTGIAYAWIGAQLGYAVCIVVPENAGPQRKHLLHALGARVIYTNPLTGMDGAIETARGLHAAEPERYFYPDQYNNPANWMAHYETTALEIWQQSGRGVTHFVAGLGTSGTFVGTSRRLKTLNPDITCVSVEPDGPFHGIEGLKHMESSTVPGIYDPGVADANIRVRTEDAYAMVRRVAAEEGLLVGVSAGAALAASLEVARSIPAGSEARIVTILCDSGERYLGERFWSGGAVT